MRSVLIIGSERMAPYARALAAEGFGVTLETPGSAGARPGDAHLVLVEVAAAGEDPEALRLLQPRPAGEGPGVIAVVEPAELPGLDPSLGVDDFVVSGATSEELLARVRLVVWRRERVDVKHTLRAGDLVMDPANYTVHLAGQPVELTYKEYELLRYLMTHRGRVVTRETLLSEVWGYDFYGGARTVDVHIRRLRSKIETRHREYIETVRNVGYRFKAGG